MPVEINEILPWGRSFDEYVAMFALSPDDLKRSILGCGDGPAAFNAELTRRGGRIVSFDPIYAFTSGQIGERIAVAEPMIVANTRAHMNAYRWDQVPTIEALVEIRRSAMSAFLDDFDAGLSEKRYIAGMLPDLPFADCSFMLALCSHLLFIYSSTLTADKHLAFIRAMARVADEVRVFPLLDMNGARSPHLDVVLGSLPKFGLCGETVQVPYEFQHGGNQMLRVTPA